MKILIVSRHEAATKFAEEEISKLFLGNVQVESVDHLDGTPAADVVVGILPIHLVHQLCQAGKEVFMISLPDVARGDRGKERTLEEMRQDGACLQKVEVKLSRPTKRIFLTREDVDVTSGPGYGDVRSKKASHEPSFAVRPDRIKHYGFDAVVDGETLRLGREEGLYRDAAKLVGFDCYDKYAVKEADE